MAPVRFHSDVCMASVWTVQSVRSGRCYHSLRCQRLHNHNRWGSVFYQESQESVPGTWGRTLESRWPPGWTERFNWPSAKNSHHDPCGQISCSGASTTRSCRGISTLQQVGLLVSHPTLLSLHTTSTFHRGSIAIAPPHWVLTVLSSVKAQCGVRVRRG